MAQASQAQRMELGGDLPAPCGPCRAVGAGAPGALAWGRSECIPYSDSCGSAEVEIRQQEHHRKEREIHTTGDSEVLMDSSETVHLSELKCMHL